MKFLIDNYAEYNNTQALYFHKHINEYEQHSAHIVSNHNMSLYDLFDTFSPDVYITSAHKLSKDSILYLKENQKDKQIKLAISIQGIKNSDVLSIEEILNKHGVNCSFFFLNSSSKTLPFVKKTNIVRIHDCADLNLELNLDIDFKLDRAFIVDQNTTNKLRSGTYHAISLNPALNGKVDFVLPINLMSAIYKKYDEIIFTDMEDYIPQAFFDAILRGNAVYYQIDNKQHEKVVDEMMAKTFNCEDRLNYNSSNRLSTFDDLKALVIEKHSSQNRTKTLLSQIPNAITKDQ